MIDVLFNALLNDNKWIIERHKNSHFWLNSIVYQRGDANFFSQFIDILFPALFPVYGQQGFGGSSDLQGPWQIISHILLPLSVKQKIFSWNSCANNSYFNFTF